MTETRLPTSQSQALGEGTLDEVLSLIGLHLRRQRHCWNTGTRPDAFVNPETDAQDSPARGHTEDAMAREAGMPSGYDVSPQRIWWLGQVVTNRIGDDGFLRMLDVKLRRPTIFGNVSWCRGSVTGKRVEDGVHLVDLDLRVENQLNEVAVNRQETVELSFAATG